MRERRRVAAGAGVRCRRPRRNPPGEPTHAAADDLSLDQVFGDDASRASPRPRPAAGSAALRSLTGARHAEHGGARGIFV